MSRSRSLSRSRRWSGKRRRSRSRSLSRSRRWSEKRRISRSWSRRDRVSRRKTEGGLEDRKQARCRIVCWEGDSIAEGLQGGAEEENKAWSQAIWEWARHNCGEKAENLNS